MILARWPWPSLKGHRKGNIELVRDMDMENIPVKFWKDPNIQESANKVSWPWPSLKGHRKVDIKIIRDIDVVNTSAEFWMDPSIPEIVIVLTK